MRENLCSQMMDRLISCCPQPGTNKLKTQVKVKASQVKASLLLSSDR